MADKSAASSAEANWMTARSGKSCPRPVIPTQVNQPTMQETAIAAERLRSWWREGPERSSPANQGVSPSDSGAMIPDRYPAFSAASERRTADAAPSAAAAITAFSSTLPRISGATCLRASSRRRARTAGPARSAAKTPDRLVVVTTYAMRPAQSMATSTG
ncbi:MAG TPA: hypothetical protein VFE90_13240 [Myxococcales bacterium]|nr:hypothetical protein [Myxococcales bacterium]